MIVTYTLSDVPLGLPLEDLLGTRGVGTTTLGVVNRHVLVDDVDTLGVLNTRLLLDLLNHVLLVNDIQSLIMHNSL